MMHIDPEGEARKVMRRLAPMLTEAFADLARPTGREQRLAAREAKLMAACKAVGKAADLVEATRYTAEEKRARAALETAARRLSKAMKEAGHVV